jgi:hypothetical protein
MHDLNKSSLNVVFGYVPIMMIFSICLIININKKFSKIFPENFPEISNRFVFVIVRGFDPIKGVVGGDT